MIFQTLNKSFLDHFAHYWCDLSVCPVSTHCQTFVNLRYFAVCCFPVSQESSRWGIDVYVWYFVFGTWPHFVFSTRHSVYVGWVPCSRLNMLEMLRNLLHIMNQLSDLDLFLKWWLTVERSLSVSSLSSVVLKSLEVISVRVDIPYSLPPNLPRLVSVACQCLIFSHKLMSHIFFKTCLSYSLIWESWLICLLIINFQNLSYTWMTIFIFIFIFMRLLVHLFICP